MNREVMTAIGSLAMVLGTGAASAAVVDWSVSDWTNVNQVSTTGTLVTAVNLGSIDDGDQVANDVGPTTPVTVNGVTFGTDPGVNDPTLFTTGVSDFVRPNYINGSITGLSDADGILLLNSYERSPGPVGELTGLTIGQAYEIQVLIDRNSSSSSHSFGSLANPGDTITAADYDADTIDVPALSPSIFTGTFVADAATQEILISEFNGPFNGVPTLSGVGEANAFQLRAVPEPGSLTLLAIGGLALHKRRRHDSHPCHRHTNVSRRNDSTTYPGIPNGKCQR